MLSHPLISIMNNISITSYNKIPIHTIYNFKLIRIVFVQKCYRNAHYTVIIRRNLGDFINVDRVVIVVFRIFGGGINPLN